MLVTTRLESWNKGDYIIVQLCLLQQNVFVCKDYGEEERSFTQWFTCMPFSTLAFAYMSDVERKKNMLK